MLGGRNLNDNVRRILFAIGRRELWNSFNLRGTTRKNSTTKMSSFLDTPLYEVVVSKYSLVVLLFMNKHTKY